MSFCKYCTCIYTHPVNSKQLSTAQNSNFISVLKMLIPMRSVLSNLQWTVWLEKIYTVFPANILSNSKGTSTGNPSGTQKWKLWMPNSGAFDQYYNFNKII